MIQQDSNSVQQKYFFKAFNALLQSLNEHNLILKQSVVSHNQIKSQENSILQQKTLYVLFRVSLPLVQQQIKQQVLQKVLAQFLKRLNEKQAYNSKAGSILLSRILKLKNGFQKPILQSQQILKKMIQTIINLYNKHNNNQHKTKLRAFRLKLTNQNQSIALGIQIPELLIQKQLLNTINQRICQKYNSQFESIEQQVYMAEQQSDYLELYKAIKIPYQIFPISNNISLQSMFKKQMSNNEQYQIQDESLSKGKTVKFERPTQQQKNKSNLLTDNKIINDANKQNKTSLMIQIRLPQSLNLDEYELIKQKYVGLKSCIQQTISLLLRHYKEIIKNQQALKLNTFCEQQNTKLLKQKQQIFGLMSLIFAQMQESSTQIQQAMQFISRGGVSPSKAFVKDSIIQQSVEK